MTDNIKKVAQLCNERNGSWVDIYEADGIDGQRVRVEVPREDCELHKVRKLLLKNGADISDLDHCRGELLNASQSEVKVIRRAGHTGWRDGGTHFVAHHKVIGAEDGSILSPPPSALVHNLGLHGTLESWQDLIKIARYSTTMILALCVAFAAPLLTFLNCPNFGIVLFGPSRTGKSQAQLVGSSAIGFGTEEDLPTLNATPAGLIEAGLSFNDSMLPINEIGTARGGKRDIYQVVHGSTYALMSGKDVIRHSSWSGANVSPGSFKVLPLLSSEYSPDEWAARSGSTRDPGETARLIGVPVLKGKQFSVFDSFPKMPSNRRKEDWVSEQFAQLRERLPNHRGVASQTFIEVVRMDMDTIIGKAKEDAETFREAMQEFAPDPIKRDIVSKFAVLYAGGMAAVNAGVLPFEEDEVWTSTCVTCQMALRTMSDPDADLKADLIKLRELLEGAGIIDAYNASTRTKKNMDGADGFYEREDPGLKYVVRSTTFSQTFASGPRTRRVLEWLDSEGYLRHQRDFKPGVSNEWAQVQTIWPSSQRIRSIVIYFPGTLDVLDLNA